MVKFYPIKEYRRTPIKTVHEIWLLFIIVCVFTFSWSVGQLKVEMYNKDDPVSFYNNKKN